MLKAAIFESLSIVYLLVEANDGGDLVLAEIREVRFRGVQWVTYNMGNSETIGAHNSSPECK